jgi:DNA-directed RNA polymerase subunit RPC12/RpoP
MGEYLSCGGCEFVGHKSEWESFKGYRRYECPECGLPRDNAYAVEK